MRLKTYNEKYRNFKEKDLEELRCSNCDKFLCYVYAFDLNDSYFYCADCFKKAKNSNYK